MDGIKNFPNNKRLVIVEDYEGFVHGLFTYGQISFV
jgi:hypothetical protein